MLTPHFQMLAQYNTLANSKLYEACSQLSNAELHRVRPAFFKSIHGTLNHILVGDACGLPVRARIWLTRFEGGEIPSTGLDAILYENFEQLRKARILEDERIERFISSLTEEFLTRTINYRNNQGNLYTDPFELLLAHFFNHQTHHRGQVHDMLSQTEIAPPSLDMHRLI